MLIGTHAHACQLTNNNRQFAEVHLSKGMVHWILHNDLQQMKRCAKLILHILSYEQKQNHILRGHNWLDKPAIINRIITGNIYV